MRKDHSFVLHATGAMTLLALALSGCATTEEVPPPAPVEQVEAPPEPAPQTEVMAEPEPAPAPVPVQLKEDAPLKYVVKKGDTLWDISQRFLKDSWQWPELWYANPDVNNPHLIYPGDVLYLYWVGGQPRLAKEGEPPPAETAGVMPPAGIDDSGPRVREMPLEEAITGIPLDAIRGFLRGPRVVSRDELEDAPYVVGFEENRLAVGDDTIAYALDVEDPKITHYQIVRIGEEYRDPDDDDVIGYEARPVADTEVRAFGDPTTTIYLARSDMETRVGDVLLPTDKDALPARFHPKAPQRKVDGRIISVYNGLSQIGQYQIVAINRGTEAGLEPGHILAVYQLGRRVKDPKSFFGSKVELPDINAGQVMVFKTTPRLSHALVLSVVRPIHILDRVETPDPNAQEAE